MISRLLAPLRASFAAKLLVGSLVLALILIGGISAYLIISRNAQTVAGALSNSDNRVSVMRGAIQQLTGTTSFSTASGLATQKPLIQALTAADPATSVPQTFAGSPPVDVSSEVLLITDASGHPLYVRAAPDLGSIPLAPFESTSAVTAALAGQRCTLAEEPGACGVDLIGGTDPSYAVAVPVLSNGQTVGVVAYVAPLQDQLTRFNTLFQFPTAFIPLNDPQSVIRLSRGAGSAGTTPSDVLSGLKSHVDLVHATYVAPLDPSGTTGQVAGSFAAVTGPDGHTIVGYVGVEVPLAPFIGDEQTDELTLVVITVFALLMMAILIIVFVEVVVRRPIRRLERGVKRIADGDYTTAVTMRSRDELGRLASSVNRMRDSIAEYTSEIEQARARLDNAVQSVSGVSRALTTTTGGVAALQREVVRTAVSIAGEGSAAALLVREGEAFEVQAVCPDKASVGDLQRWDRFPTVLKGRIVRQTKSGAGSMLAVPMFYQDIVVGVLAVVASQAKLAPAADEEEVLVVLANNAAIAMENTRLYEQEKETVHRLRQLDAMKTDFLSTVQHELRTPLTAILGLSDLIDMCWDRWDDAPKLEAVRDIQLAARNLYDIVETIID
ncbi:MAG: HAMP domain-containing protein, partial [Candidatus Dormibacteraeota bacterium]|nr:HAMP domain-containing protein [Candidatus Dormibacteraeota bacterium]